MDELDTFLQELQGSMKTFIVEGPRDEVALSEIGVKKIFAINNKPIHRVIDQVSVNKEVVILTDLDSAGKELYRRIKTQLQDRGVTVDHYFREFLQRNTKLRQIESIKGLFGVGYPSLAVLTKGPSFMNG